MKIAELKERIKNIPDDWDVSVYVCFQSIEDSFKNKPKVDIEIDEDTHSMTIFSYVKKITTFDLCPMQAPS